MGVQDRALKLYPALLSNKVWRLTKSVVFKLNVHDFPQLEGVVAPVLSF